MAVTMTKAQLAEREDAIKKLQDILGPGDRVYTILRHVSSSGMSRIISLVVVQDGHIRNIDFLVNQLGHYKRTGINSRHDGLRVSGAGMDMGFAVVYDLAMTLFNDGYKLKQEWL